MDKRPIIVLDAGHGGSDGGAKAINGELEKNINLEVVKYIKKFAKPYERQIKLIYTRLDDEELSLRKRTDFANLVQANLYVSVHHNASGVGATGSETIHSIHGGQGEHLANLIMDEFNKTGQNSRRVFSKESNIDDNMDYFYVIRHTAMPSVITEFAFLDSEDFKDIDTPEERKSEALAILKGILKYFDIEYVEEKNVVTPTFEDWKIKILDDAYSIGMFKDYDLWKAKLDSPMPTWAVMAMIYNMHK